MKNLALKNLALSVFLSLGLAGGVAHAALTPVTQGGDGRVQEVTFKANQVFVINAKAGVVTNIILEPDEVYLTHAFGDSKAWHFSTYGNNVFIKPAIENSNTNLVLITNKRTYNFEIKYTKSVMDEVYQVKFTYPDTLQKQQALEAKSKLMDNVYKGKIFNLDYVQQGDTTIAPVNVWDDGTFTYFKFAGNTDLPAIYAVIESEDGNEAIVNRTVTGKSNNIIVMHKVNPMWRFRLGNAVLNIYNKQMNWLGVENKTGTATADVQRTIIGGDENE